MRLISNILSTAHDMFTPQPEALRAPDLFVLRGILHDWSDTYAMKILKHLRAAAGPRTQLLIIDSVLRYACPPDPQRTETFKVPKLVEPPAPLLANMGGAASLHYAYDIVVSSNYQYPMAVLLLNLDMSPSF